MFRYAVIFLVLSLIAGGIGLTNISVFFKRVSMVFFALFFLGFLALLGIAYLLGEAFNAGARAEVFAPLLFVQRIPAAEIRHRPWTALAMRSPDAIK